MSEIAIVDFGNAPMVPLVEPALHAYIQFLNGKARIYGELKQQFPAAKENDPFLKLFGTFSHHPELGFFLTKCWRQYAAAFNKDNELIRASEVKSPLPEGLSECIEAIILVHHQEKFIPASIRVARARCSGLRSAYRTSSEAEEASWGDRSAEHAATIKALEAGKLPSICRVYHSLTVTNEAGENYDYSLTRCVSRPASIVQLSNLAAYVRTKEFADLWALAQAAFTKTMAEIDSCLS